MGQVNVSYSIKWKWLTIGKKLSFSFTVWLDLPTPPKACQCNFLVKCVTSFICPIFSPGPSELLLPADCCSPGLPRAGIPAAWVWSDLPFPGGLDPRQCPFLVHSFPVIFLQKLPDTRGMGAKCSEIVCVWQSRSFILTLDWTLLRFSLYLCRPSISCWLQGYGPCIHRTGHYVLQFRELNVY